jgi:hypothetical protein
VARKKCVSVLGQDTLRAQTTKKSNWERTEAESVLVLGVLVLGGLAVKDEEWRWRKD